MMMRWLAVLALLLGSLSPLSAQPIAPGDPLATRFAEDASEHVRDVRDLYLVRGATPPRMKSATLADVMKFLATQRDDQTPGYPEGTAVLFYSHKGDRLAIYLISRNGILAYHEAQISPEELRLSTVNYRIDLDVDGIARSRAPIFTGSGAAPLPLAPAVSRSKASRYTPIADILLPPTIRKGLGGVRHLVIVANGVIATNPFAAFPLAGKEQLIDRMSITVSAGLFDLDQMIRPWKGVEEYRDLLVVGDPRVPPSPDWKVAPLPGAASEALMLADLAAVDALVGDAATKSAVVSRMESARMLYFAAHGVSDPRQPLTGGFLMLAGPSPAEAFLTAGEVQKMQLEADLVVLSACQSGLGLNHEGGVIGLARAFQKAGAPRVVMSLWSVSDEATVYLMDHFQRAAMSKVPAEALRVAMLETRKKYPDPALWAPFTLFGTPR